MCHPSVSRNPGWFFRTGGNLGNMAFSCFLDCRFRGNDSAQRASGWVASPGKERGELFLSAKMLLRFFSIRKGGFPLPVGRRRWGWLRCGLQTTTVCVASVSALYLLWPRHCNATVSRRWGPDGQAPWDLVEEDVIGGNVAKRESISQL